MRVAIAPTAPDSVYNYRTRYPARFLDATGEIELFELEEEVIGRYAKREHGPLQLVGLKNLPDVDVIVLTRVLAGPLVEYIPLIQARGIAVAVDLDDDFKHTYPLLNDRHKMQPTNNPRYNWQQTLKACQAADLMTCSTEPLTRYARGRVVVLKNAVPQRYLTIRTERDGKTVGWAGVVGGHPNDLEATRGGVGAAIRATSADFMVVGDGRHVSQRLDLPAEPYVTGVVEFERYAFKVAEFDVGIAPLADNAFTRAKSWLKPLEYLSLGTPFVASPSPEYTMLTGELTRWCAQNDSPVPGALAKSRSRDWRRCIVEALRTPEEAREAARQFVAESHTIERNAHRWAEAWRDAVKERKAKAKCTKANSKSVIGAEMLFSAERSPLR